VTAEKHRENPISEILTDPDGILSSLFFPAMSVFLGLASAGVLMLFLGHNPAAVYGDLFSFAFRDIYNIADIFAKAAPLILTGLAFAFAFRAGLFNIGAQGQFYLGAVASAACALSFPSLPSWLLLPLCAAASMAAGGLWAGMTGYFKARFNANEFLVSMMSTYVAVAIMDFLVRSPLREAKGEYPQTDVLAEAAWIPSFLPGTRFHWGFFLALAAAGAAWVLLWKTTLGFRMRAVGKNRSAARFAGISEKSVFVSVFLVSGAFAGLAGFLEVNGVQHMVVQGFNPLLGAEGIGIAVLGSTHPLGVVLSALLFGALKVGGLLVTQTSSVPSSIIAILEGFVMLYVILSFYLRHRLRRAGARRRAAAGGEAP